MSDCKSCASKGKCSSEGKKDISGGCSAKPADDRMTTTLSRIGNKIVVMSGKGGVGKSTVAVNIAVSLALAGKKVGLLDVDVHGPSVPRLLALSGETPHAEAGYMEPVAWSPNLSVMSMGFLLNDPNQPVVWRGPVKMGVIKQFLRDVAWGDLDFLIVDCPPGTGDEPLTVLQTLGSEAMAVVVTTPQMVAIDDVRRSIGFCKDLGTPVLGVVENMSGFVCDGCGKRHEIFNTGAGERLALDTGVNFLGRIPFDPELARSGDEGFAYAKVFPDTETARAMQKIVEPMLKLDDAKKAAAASA